MALFSRVKTWVSNEVLTASDLNAEFNNILTNFTPSGMDGASSNVANMQSTADPGGVGTESLAGDLLGELKRLRFKFKQILGTAQWYSAPISTLGTGGIATSSLADGAVTQAKRAALGEVLSSSSSGFTSTSTSYVDVTNLTSGSYTTTGRRVRLVIIPDGSAAANVGVDFTATGPSVTLSIRFLRDSTPIGDYDFPGLEFNGASSSRVLFAVGTLEASDKPSAGSYTYKVQVKTTAGTALVQNVKLLVMEL